MGEQSSHVRSRPRVPTIVWILSAFVVGGWFGPPFPTVQASPEGEPGASPALQTTAPAPPSMPRPSVSPPVLLPTPPRPSADTTLPGAPAKPDPPPPCAFADEVTGPGPGGDWTLAVLDTALRLPRGYAPDDLVPVARAGLSGGGQVRELILADLTALKSAADAAGVPLTVRSAYRSEARQRAVFDGWVRSVGREAAQKSSARPGHSEHQLGTTLDLAAGAEAPWTGHFGSTPTGRWLAAHAAEFGFVISYPADGIAITCYAAEPWHVRWIGRDAAARVAASGLTLREWLWALR